MSKRIMVVDDASFMRQMIKDIIIDSGYEFAGEAEDGVKAVNLYKSVNPDIVTMDIVMKNKSGIDTVKEIIEIDKNAKILMISAMGQQAMIVDAIQAGAKGFVLKPFKPDVLIDEINRLAGKR